MTPVDAVRRAGDVDRYTLTVENTGNVQPATGRSP